MVYCMIQIGIWYCLIVVSVYNNITTNAFLCTRLKSKGGSRTVKDAKADFDWIKGTINMALIWSKYFIFKHMKHMYSF